MQGATGGIIPAGPPVQRVYDIARVESLEELAEIAGMWCEKLPVEVREALHAIPDISKTHDHRRDVPR